MDAPLFSDDVLEAERQSVKQVSQAFATATAPGGRWLARITFDRSWLLSTAAILIPADLLGDAHAVDNGKMKVKFTPEY